MLGKLSQLLGWASDGRDVSKNAPGQSPVRPRSEKMDAFFAHIHRNPQLTVEQLIKAIDTVKRQKGSSI